MAEIERTALLIEHDILHGVALAGDRERQNLAVADSWPFFSGGTPSEDDAGIDPGAPEADAAGDSLTDALRHAKRVLKVEAGCALALPTRDLIIRVMTLPPADKESLGGIVRLQMEKIAPCAGEDLSVSYEVVAQEEEGVRLFAAAIPQERLDELAQQVADAGLRLTRIDAALLGWWRQLINHNPDGLHAGTVALLLEEGGNWDFVLAEAGEFRLARGLGGLLEPADLGRELTLSLLNYEMESGVLQPQMLFVVSATQPDQPWLQALQDAVGGTLEPQWIDRLQLGHPGLGCALREGEAERLDLVPDAWRTQELDQKKRKRFMMIIGAAVGLWLVLAALLWTAPMIVRQRTAAVSAKVEVREADYFAVSDLRQRVRLIREYMDRSQSLLEIFRDVCYVMPDGLELGSLTYRRADVVKLTGTADLSAQVLALKDSIEALGRFENIRLNGPTRDSQGRYRFEIEARFKERES